MTEHLLSINLLIALAGLFFIALTNREKTLMIKTVSLVITGLQFWIAIEIFFNFNPTETALQFSERIRWITALRIDYYLGVDSINLLFLSVTALLIFLTVVISWKTEKRIKDFYMLLLIADIGLTGVFSAMNLFLFFIFLGVTFFAIYLMIGIWSDKSDSNPANRVGIYLMLGYSLILLGLILLFHESRIHSLNLTELISGNTLPYASQMVILVIFLIGFAMLIPLFPFHSWLIPVINKAPLGVSILVVGILTKVGVYGLVRIIAPVMPAAFNILALGFGIWGLVNLIYGALCALGTEDTDQIIGYYTIQQMGIILIGFATIVGGLRQNLPATETGLSGAMIMVISHACLITLLLVILKKAVPDGIHPSQTSPGMRPIIVLALLGGLGMPGMSDFIAKFLTLLGAYQIPGLTVIVIISMIGIFLNFVVFLRLFKRLIFNPPSDSTRSTEALDFNERFAVIILIIVIVMLGIFPGPLLGVIKTGLVKLVEMFSLAVAM